MRTFVCSCKNTLYFDNIVCIKCQHTVGWCPTCRAVTDVVPLDNAPEGQVQCATCKTLLIKCHNYAAYNVCNRFVAAPEPTPPPPPPQSTLDGSAPPAPPAPLPLFCDGCRFNHTIPDLTIPDNKAKWARLEAAKRRTLYDLTQLGFPFGNAADNIDPPLSFEFKADIIPDQVYRDMGDGEKVYTGHANGVITINVQEADDVEREKLRVGMHEAQRSLLGHFRHEFGHYVWELTVKGRREPDCVALFGDHNNPTYADALQAYYQNGPKPDWLLNYVSPYATMHAWEDFAETFAVYLDMTSALDTAYHNKLIRELQLNDLEWMSNAYQKLGIALNEMNRANGLLDYLPEVLAAPVTQKLKFIHDLRTSQPPMKDVQQRYTPAASVVHA